MALRDNDADGYKPWLALGIEQLGREAAGEVESDWMVRERPTYCLAARGEPLTRS